MGLLDILSGLQAPAGQQSSSNASSGMSPIAMAVIGLLAYKALKGNSSQPNPAAPANTGGTFGLPNMGGGLGDLLKGGLGTLLAGGTGSSVVNGGLSDLLQKFQQSGLGDVAKSWVGTGQNMPVSADQLAQVLGSDKIKELMAHSGLSRDQLLAGLSQHLPGIVDKLTPEGRLAA
jgi:uncharacterized protein YidB (DUF937 family)